MSLVKKSFVKIGEQELTVHVHRDTEVGVVSVEVMVTGSTEAVTFSACQCSDNVVIVDGQVLRAERTNSGTEIVVDSRRVPVSVTDRPSAASYGLGRANKPKQAGVRAPLPGQVVAVLVSESARVEAGEHLVVIEAMKMQNPVIAERAGTVHKLYVQPGDSVQTGDKLVDLTREE